MKIEIDEYIDNLAADFFVESVGEVPRDSEALFMRIRVKKFLDAQVDIKEDNETGEIIVSVQIGDINFTKKDSLLEMFYINEWKNAYCKAVVKDICDRLPDEAEILIDG